jgi:hypothetical protein
VVFRLFLKGEGDKSPPFLNTKSSVFDDGSQAGCEAQTAKST